MKTFSKEAFAIAAGKPCGKCGSLSYKVATQTTVTGSVIFPMRCGVCSKFVKFLAAEFSVDDLRAFTMPPGTKYAHKRLDQLPSDYLGWAAEKYPVDNIRNKIRLFLESFPTHVDTPRK